MERKDSKDTVRAFLTMITKRTQLRKVWVDKEAEFSGKFKKFCKAEGVQSYSTMSEIKVAFAERKIRFLKKLFYRYKKEYGYK